MTLRVWEIVTAVLGAAFAAIFIFSNASGLGFALLAADGLWVVTRLRIEERHDQAGRYATLRGRLGLAKVILLLLIYAAAVWGLFVIKDDVGGKARATIVAAFAVAGLCYFLLTELRRGADDALNWLRGGRAESLNGADLGVLEEHGWLVLHNYKRERGGDIDHIVCGPHGAYAIETKSYGFRYRDMRQTKSNAWWLHEKLGIPWATGILCVAEDHPPEHKDPIWVVGRDHLVSFIESQRHTGIDPEVARRRLEPAA